MPPFFTCLFGEQAIIGYRIQSSAESNYVVDSITDVKRSLGARPGLPIVLALGQSSRMRGVKHAVDPAQLANQRPGYVRLNRHPVAGRDTIEAGLSRSIQIVIKRSYAMNDSNRSRMRYGPYAGFAHVCESL